MESIGQILVSYMKIMTKKGVHAAVLDTPFASALIMSKISGWKPPFSRCGVAPRT